jgi:hypothetical protein
MSFPLPCIIQPTDVMPAFVPVKKSEVVIGKLRVFLTSKYKYTQNASVREK